MKAKITNNKGLKILSVLMAIGIWLIVVNISNPYTTRTISGIPIEVINEDTLTKNDLTYTITGGQTATVKVRAPRKTVQRLTASDFKATADFNRLYEMTNRVPVTVTSLTNSITDNEITQMTQSMSVEIESISSRKIDVTTEIEGTPAEGYEVGKITTNPTYISVTAPKSILDQIAKIGVVIDVDGLNKDVSQHAAVNLYNAGGSVIDTSEMTNLKLSAADVDVDVSILSVKNVDITANVTGTDAVARGYRYAGMEISPNTVEISGRKKALDKITSLSLPDGSLDLTGATESVVKTFKLNDLSLPDNISLVAPGETDLVVTLLVEKTNTKTFKLDLSTLVINNLDENLKIGNTDETLNVTVEGLSEELNSLEASEITAILDLAGLTAGTQTVNAEVSVPEGFSVVGNATISLNLVDQTATTVAENQVGAESTSAEKKKTDGGDETKSGEDLKSDK